MSVTVVINENWKVKVDDFNHQLIQWKEGGVEIKAGKNKGKLTEPRWEPLQSYHPTMQQALKAIIQKQSLEDAAGTEVQLEDWKQHMKSVEEAVLDVYFVLEEDK